MSDALLKDIYSILSHENDPIIEEIRIEGIFCIRDHCRGAHVINGGISAIHSVLSRLQEQKRPPNTTDKVKMRCIGALGLMLRRDHFGKNISDDLKTMRDWLFGIAVSSTEELEQLVSKRAGFVLIADRIIQRS